MKLWKQLKILNNNRKQNRGGRNASSIFLLTISRKPLKFVQLITQGDFLKMNFEKIAIAVVNFLRQVDPAVAFIHVTTFFLICLFLVGMWVLSR